MRARLRVPDDQVRPGESRAGEQAHGTRRRTKHAQLAHEPLSNKDRPFILPVRVRPQMRGGHRCVPPGFPRSQRALRSSLDARPRQLPKRPWIPASSTNRAMLSSRSTALHDCYCYPVVQLQRRHSQGSAGDRDAGAHDSGLLRSADHHGCKRHHHPHSREPGHARRQHGLVALRGSVRREVTAVHSFAVVARRGWGWEDWL